MRVGVAQVVLAGGMATRFGGVVKGAVEALDGHSFLSWKLGETARLAAALGVEIPVALMTSFQTEDETRAHVARPGACQQPLWFSQYVSLRLDEDGELFLDGGRPSLYAPGHGDLLDAIRRSGTLAALREPGSSTSRCRTSTTSARGSIPWSSAHTCSLAADDRRGRAQGGRHGRRTRPCRRPARPARRPAVPARLRPGPDPRLQHEHDDVRPRRDRPRVRPGVAVRPEAGGRPSGGAARAAVPPGCVGAGRDLPRGAARGRSAAGSSRSRSPRTSSASGRRSARCSPRPCSTRHEPSGREAGGSARGISSCGALRSSHCGIGGPRRAQVPSNARQADRNADEGRRPPMGSLAALTADRGPGGG